MTDILQLDEMEITKISYITGALINQKSVYGFALTIKYGSIISQLVFGSFSGVSGIAVRGKSGSPLQWKDWKLL